MLENYPYCPTLFGRGAEIKALAQLPSATKDKIFPLIIARPWQNANDIEKTWLKIQEAFGNRRFALDLDRTKRSGSPSKNVQIQFNKLFNEDGGFKNYYEQISKIPLALPVWRLDGRSDLLFDAQAKHVDKLDRGLVLRIEHGLTRSDNETIKKILMRFDDISIFIDVGWSRDILGREGWASDLIEFISSTRLGIEIVVSGSSFPDSFSNIGERGEVSVSERYLYDSLVRRHNSATLIYGDWASTRPPADPVPMTNIPRIDLPNPRQWICFRRDKDVIDDENYQDIAQRVIQDKEWPKDLNIWGTYVIDWTAKGEPGAIRSPNVAAAARINIHLHRQAFFGIRDVISDTDEPFTDD